MTLKTFISASAFFAIVTQTLAAPADHFVTTWATNKPGRSNATSIIIPTKGAGYNYNVDWDNDGIFDEFGIVGDVTHDFGVVGVYTIRIQGAFPRIFFDSDYLGDDDKILSVDQWGTGNWTSMAGAFSGARNLTITAMDTPDFSAVTDMSDMFGRATLANPDTRL